ncbi:exosome complex component CSL4-like isoform X2 [Acanthaster planci]|uniref:Exosome complex component CSL4-like isoform X2 n=1 Tax=Acanthaster planci TaxID=133434 RepID=A0A8B7ZKK5_ACAPL|nr:exosome complex component CSL4-like isoform X2 [Acanthaster planci]
MAASSICIPGQRLGSTEDYQAGKGTYTRQGYIYSSLAGFRHESKHGEEVLNVNPRFCRCAILSVEGTPLTQSFRGMIRREDIRATEKDKVEVYKSFRPGDVVLARILSLGDAQWYLLSTAENELGVVLAQSEAGVNMVPISWSEMVCPKTHCKEFRKVARVQPQYLIQPTGT